MRKLFILARQRQMVVAVAMAAVLTFASARSALAGPFSTFVTNASISAATGGDTSVISYTYAGNKFVGGLYPNDNRLYSTDLNGGSVKLFGTVPGASGEVICAASLGTGGFSKGDIYAGSGASGQVYFIPNAGGAGTAFLAAPLVGAVRQITFDTGGKFGGDMIVTTTSGNIYRVNSAGTPTIIASVGEDTEGVDVITSKWGKYAGDLLVASEGSGSLRIVDPTLGVVRILPTLLSEAESVSFVPLNLGASGNPLEGLYVANYPVDIQKAPASAFAGLQGDAIVSQEFGSNAPFTDISYDTTTDTFTYTPFGNLPDQAEDAVFVTAQRISTFVPEPSGLLLLATAGGVGAIGTLVRRRRRAA